MVIYLTENKINGKKYIGQDMYNNPKYLGSGFLLKKAIKKYGEENFTKIILEECDNKEELNGKEIYWINHYNATNSLEFYNIATGGQGGWLGDEINEKRRKTLTGHKHSDETKEKIRNKALGRVVSDETRKKMSKSQKGMIKHKDKTKIMGSNNPNAKQVAQYDLKGNLIKIWACVKYAADSLGIKSSANISECVNNNRKTAGGYVWKKLS